MSKKTSEVEDCCLCMDDYFPKCDGTRTHPMLLSEILSIDKVQQHLAKEKMELVEEICKIIDEIELDIESDFEEWKMFKRIRNTIRTRYLKSEEVGK